MPTDAHGVAAAFLLSKREPTRSAYRRDLADFGEFLSSIGLDPLGVRRVHVDSFVETLRRHGASDATIARRLACLSGFYRYAQSEDLVAANPVEHVDRPSVGDDSQVLGLDIHQARRFLRAADAASERDRALAYLLLHLGLRVSEAIGIDVDDLQTVGEHRTVWIVRKGSKRRQLAMSPACAHAVHYAAAGRTHGPLLITASGRRLDRHHAAKIVKRLARSAGVTQDVTPHSLRHTFITLALDAGASLRDVQDAAGHADPRTTRRYDRARNELKRSPSYKLAAELAG